jgi:GTP-binding protein
MMFAGTSLTPLRVACCRLAVSVKRNPPSQRSMVTKRRGGRHYARRKQEQSLAAAAAKPRPRPPKSAYKNVAPSDRSILPPALLAPTASPFVYVSKPALAVQDGDDDDAPIDPSTLFTETGLPPTFLYNEFAYVSPKVFNHKLPSHGVPEVCFLGRSNVGKSSLVNSLMRRKLAFTSKSPGRTQQACYFGLYPTTVEKENRGDANAIGFLVDLPGYGFAKAPDSKVEEWQTATQELIIDRFDRGVMQRLFLLIDSRRGPLPLDRSVMTWLDDKGIPYSVVLTKADQVAIPMVVKEVNALCLRYASQQALEESVTQSPVVHVTSSQKSLGIHELMLSVETEFIGDDE